MALKNFHKVIEETPEDVRGFVEHAMDILDRIHELLEEKFDGKQKLLADKLGKSEAEISKMLSGVQNFTLKTIARLEWAFGAKIIAICTSDLSAEFVPVKTQPDKGCKKITLTERMTPKEQHFDKVSIKSDKNSISQIMCSAS